MQTTYLHLINGEWVPSQSGREFITTNPADGSALASVAQGDAADIDRAVQGAHKAFRPWARMDPAQRGRILLQIAHRLLERRDELARIETLDNGKPLAQARRDVETAARYFEFYAGVADKHYGETMPPSDGNLIYTVREPFGVTGHIIPWNVAMQQFARGVAPALAAGNTAVVKPAEQTPLASLELARIAMEAGLPPGVLNVVSGFGAEAGAPLVAHPLVRKVTFTGSVATGKAVAHLAAERVIPLTLELGGKSPQVIFADADLEKATAVICRSILLNAGQVCSAGSRVVVDQSVYAEVTDRIAAGFARVTIGPGLENPDLGPLVSAEQQRRVLHYLEAGRNEGARLVSGGGVPGDPRLAGGNFVCPTLFADVTGEMRINREEIFGPVLTVTPFRTDAEAVAIANDSPYGLAAGVWTRDGARAHRVALQLEAGQVFLNTYGAGGVQVPFGGYKESGYGREKGLEALHHYTQVKAIVAEIGQP